PFTVARAGADVSFVSRWPMPFRRRVSVAVLAGGAGHPFTGGEITAEPAAWTDASLVFHARWLAPSAAAALPQRDLELLRVDGAGAYVGNALDVVNPPDTMWWGEGDEKITV